MSDIIFPLGKTNTNGKLNGIAAPVMPMVRIVGPANSDMLVGYPGISATLPRIQGKVEIRPDGGISAPVGISYVSIGLYREESIHPHAGSVVSSHLAAPRKDSTDLVGKELRLYQCPPGRSYENVLAMDLPFILIIPYAKAGEDVVKVPPASLRLPNRTVETKYELVVSVKQGHTGVKKYKFPIPLQRYDTLSTFGMYRGPIQTDHSSDHITKLELHLGKWAFGPNDPIHLQIRVLPNPDWPQKAKKVSIKKLVAVIEEVVVYNHEGDEPSKKVKQLLTHQIQVNQQLPETGYTKNVELNFPSTPILDNDGCLPVRTAEFPHLEVHAFTTTAGLYKIDYYIRVKAHLSRASDVATSSKIVVTPFDTKTCQEEMAAIEQAAYDATLIDEHNPMVPAPTIIRPTDHNAFHVIGCTYVGNVRKPWIE